MKRIIAGLSVIVFAASAQTTTERRHFEAAAVQRSATATNPETVTSGGVLRGERYQLSKASMLDMIRIAYDVDPNIVFGGPNWLEFDRFDIAAKAPAGTPLSTVRLMLQSLLADRFGLVIHHDTRLMPAFALTQSRNKPKLEISEGSANSGCDFVQQPKESTFNVYSCRNVTMAAFAQWLHAFARDYLVEPVIDKTQLDGAWNLILRWNGRARTLAPGAERITIFDAVEKDLGLSLRLTDSPQPVLIVDRVTEQPAPDPPGTAQKLPKPEAEFEVADLKPSRPEEGPALRQMPGGGLQARAYRLEGLMAAAWDTDEGHPERFSGLPQWAQSAKFDINAKPPANANGLPIVGSGYIDDAGRMMLRNLLIERFHIRWHYENRLLTAWSLVSAKPKLASADASKRAICRRALKEDPRDSNPMISFLLVCQNVTTAQFASRLQSLDPSDFPYPVEDATGLSGSWDFRLNFTPTSILRSMTREAGDGRASEPTGGISIQDAIVGQLGLKLEQRKRMLPVIVIDHIEEKPTGN
jgi:uncharacterized protein (TIGR03435 family)